MATSRYFATSIIKEGKSFFGLSNAPSGLNILATLVGILNSLDN